MNKTKSTQSRMLRLQYALFCLGKTFRARKKDELSEVTTDLPKHKCSFTVINDEGKEVVCNVLFTFDNADESRHYIVYTDETKDEDGNVQVYASMYDPQQGKKMELLPIETPEEWGVIEEILSDIQEKIKNGEPIDSICEDDDDEEDEVLEPLSLVICKRLSDWTDRFHFPVGALVPYIVGIILFRFVCPDQLPIWAHIGFAVIELILMRITYDDIERTHSTAAWSITMFLYMDILTFFLVHLSAKLYPNTARVTFEPWLFRVAIIIVNLVIFLRTQWKKRRMCKTHRAKTD